MQTERYCAFCQMIGIPAPHDHYVRASRAPNARVTCPHLLSTECSFCKKKGHTAKYCGERQDNEKYYKKLELEEKKSSFNSGGWMSKPIHSRSNNAKTSLKPIDIISSGFNALFMDNSSDSEQDCGCEEEKVVTEAKTTPSWSDIAKRAPKEVIAEPIEVIAEPLQKRPEGMSWADWADEDDDDDYYYHEE